MKKCPNLLYLLVLLASTASFSQKKSLPGAEKYDWFPFQWQGDTVSNRYFDKLAITIPIHIDGIKGNTVAQFDMGADVTSLYGNAIKHYFGTRQQLFSRVDTTGRDVSDAGSIYYRTKDVDIRVGKQTIERVYLQDNYGDEIPADSLYTSSAKVLGTIGADFAKDKILIIDYPHQRMCLLDTVDAYWKDHTTFTACRIKKGRIQIPITINGVETWFLFDTGASLFPLNTDHGTWKGMVNGDQATDSLRGNSWGEQVTFYGAPIGKAVYIGKAKMGPEQAWYCTNQRLLDLYKGEKVSGLTGNAYFFNDIIMLDFKHGQFGIVRK
jgi:hypothetical protein